MSEQASGAELSQLDELERRVKAGELSREEAWRLLSKELIDRKHPFSLNALAFSKLYGEGPGIAWSPTESEKESTNIAMFCKKHSLSGYEALFEWSVSKRKEFWKVFVDEVGIPFRRQGEKILDVRDGVGVAKWFPDSELNIVESCFRAEPSAPAIVYQRPGEEIQTLSYAELDALSNQVANSLLREGFKKGDAIAIDMPMTVESVGIYLGILKVGCVAVSIADSFAAEEIGTRLRIANARGIFTQKYIGRAGKQLPLYKKVIQANAPRAIVVCEEGDTGDLRDGDLSWDQFLGKNQTFVPVAMDPEDPINILFSSGTTGDPKAIPWKQTTPIKCAMDGYFHHDIQVGDVVAWPTNLGWMMGPWLIFASLMNRGTIALYYDAPLSKGFGEFVRDAKIKMLGLVPSVVKAWRQSQCMEDLDWSHIKCFSSTGECSNAEDYLYLMWLANYRPVVEYCGGTEIGGGYISGTLVQPASPGTFTGPTLGLDFCILDEENRSTDNGELFLVPPSIGLSTTLLNRDHHEVYYAGAPKGPNGETLRRHGDQFERVGNFYRGHGRTDDTMNLGGIKVSSAEIERVLNQISVVVETAAIAVSPPGGGPSQLVVYGVLSGEADNSKLLSEMQNKIKTELNPLYKIQDLVIVDKLPRTASNKVMRRVLRSEYSAK